MLKNKKGKKNKRKTSTHLLSFPKYSHRHHSPPSSPHLSFSSLIFFLFKFDAMSPPIPTSNLTGFDPQMLVVGTAEIVSLSIQSLIILCNLVLVGYVMVHRNYPPLKIKQVPVVAATFVCKFFLFVFLLCFP